MELDVAVSGEVFMELNKVLEFAEEFSVTGFEV